MGVIVPLEELRARPLPHAIPLFNLGQLAAGEHSQLPPATRVAVTVRGDEPYADLAVLKGVDPIMVLVEIDADDERVSRVHASRRWAPLPSFFCLRRRFFDGFLFKS